MEKTIKVNRNLECLEKGCDLDSAWEFLKSDLEKFFANFLHGFTSVPVFSVSKLFKPSVLVLVIPEPENEEKKEKEEPPDLEKQNTNNPTYSFVGNFKDFTTQETIKDFSDPFLEPITFEFESYNLPKNLTLSLHDVPNRRQITLIAKDLFVRMTVLRKNSDETKFFLNKEAVSKYISQSNQSQLNLNSRKRKRNHKGNGNEEHKVPKLDQIYVGTEVIGAKQVEMELFVDEICRFIKFKTEKCMLLKFEKFPVNDENEILFDETEKETNSNWYQWTKV